MTRDTLKSSGNFAKSRPDTRRYCRYVDDVFLLVRKAHALYNLKDLFESKSVLSFTYDIENNTIVRLAKPLVCWSPMCT